MYTESGLLFFQPIAPSLDIACQASDFTATFEIVDKNNDSHLQHIGMVRNSLTLRRVGSEVQFCDVFHDPLGETQCAHLVVIAVHLHCDRLNIYGFLHSRAQGGPSLRKLPTPMLIHAGAPVVRPQMRRYQTQYRSLFNTRPQHTKASNSSFEVLGGDQE